MRPTSAYFKVADACFGNFYERAASSDELDAASTTSYWAWERDGTGRLLLGIGSAPASRDGWNWFTRRE